MAKLKNMLNQPICLDFQNGQVLSIPAKGRFDIDDASVNHPMVVSYINKKFLRVISINKPAVEQKVAPAVVAKPARVPKAKKAAAPKEPKKEEPKEEPVADVAGLPTLDDPGLDTASAEAGSEDAPNLDSSEMLFGLATGSDEKPASEEEPEPGTSSAKRKRRMSRRSKR